MSYDDLDTAALRVPERAALYRRSSPAFAHFAAGYGVIQHTDETQVRVWELAQVLETRGVVRQADEVYALLSAADRVASAGMWLVVHQTYAARVHLDGRDLAREDFKATPEGHTGGALNMVPAYVGYLTANSLSGLTRSWVMGQGHVVSAIDSVNLLVGNVHPEHAERYDLSDEGLTRFVEDFYSYAVRPDGQPASPLGSHVGPHTAGGVMEGGYLGFAELQWVHMPLPGERLVAFLSDGAFEEQRGSDWAPRWWRAEDTGLVAPILIANGRRIDQRTTIAQQGGTGFLRHHLRLNNFDPIDLDGRDPAAFTWGIFEMEERLAAAASAVAAGRTRYPVPLPYAIAETVKGYGFIGAGSNAAHNLPLGENPAVDEGARTRFNRGARDLWVPVSELQASIARLNEHEVSHRVRERDHAMATRAPALPRLPEPPFRDTGEATSAMSGIDDFFTAVCEQNPQLRVRVGNPDELRSNGMSRALDLLKHRVTAPEPGVAEAIDGKVITALNEEAVVCAALANKAGLNLVVTYEAFAPKMLGAVRQEIIFARHQREVGRPPGWLAVPLVLTSHTWENGKNEQSHQDTTMAEALIAEPSDVSRVVFPADANSAMATLEAVYRRRGELWTLVVPKRPVPSVLKPRIARELVERGGARLHGGPEDPVILAAVGAYQLGEVLRASMRLRERGLPHAVVYLLEPARFREPRDAVEAGFVHGPAGREALFPKGAPVRVFLGHVRPEALAGALRSVDTGAERTRFLGYINRGGTLDTPGMLFANRATWAHVVAAVAGALGRAPSELLLPAELAAVRGEGDPRCLR